MERKKTYTSRFGISSILNSPIIFYGKITGVVSFEDRKKDKKWTNDEYIFASYISDYISLLKENNEKKEIAKNIKSNEERLKRILDTAVEGFWEIDNDNITVDVNPEMCTILGLEKNKIVGHSIFEFVDQENEIIFKAQAEMRNRGLKGSYEILLKKPDGKSVNCFFNASPLYDSDGKKIGTFALVADIEVRKQMEEELKNTRNYLRNIFNSLSSILISINKKGVISEWNTAAEKYTGILSSSAISKNISEVLPFIKDYEDIIKKVLTTKETIEIFKANIESSEKKIFNISFFPLFYSLTEGVVIRIDDITEIEKKDEQLRQAQKMDTIGNLAGGLAHDFNNVLGGIIGTISLLKHNLNKGEKIDNEDLKSKIKIIENSSKRAEEMVRRLLMISRKQELSISPVDLNTIISHVMKICENTFDKSIDIKINIPKDQSIIEADSTQIEQILLNLCINASHAMTIMRKPEEKTGGILTITLNKLLADKYFCATHPEAKEGIVYWLLRVSDTGIGIDSDTIVKIFDPFFTTKEKLKGTGLGLSMVYSIVHQHNGFIDVYSQPGVGSTFNVYFPLIETHIDEVEKQKEEEVPMGSGLILVIDDEELIRETAGNILKECGYSVIFAIDGEDGIKKYEERKDEINLILLDMSMPKISGKEAFIKIRSINPKVKILLTSGFRQDIRVHEVLEDGASGFIQKPFTLNVLAKKVKEII